MAVVGGHAHLLYTPGRRYGRHLVDDGGRGATRYPVPALFHDDGDTHGR